MHSEEAADVRVELAVCKLLLGRRQEAEAELCLSADAPQPPAKTTSPRATKPSRMRCCQISSSFDENSRFRAVVCAVVSLNHASPRRVLFLAVARCSATRTVFVLQLT